LDSPELLAALSLLEDDSPDEDLLSPDEDLPSPEDLSAADFSFSEDDAAAAAVSRCLFRVP
jgi:hypothetical protein